MRIAIQLIIILWIIYGCSNREVQVEHRPKRDTIIFVGQPKNTVREVLGQWGLKNQNNEFLSSIYEDSSVIVKASPGNLDLKFNLMPMTNNIIIEPNGNVVNEFIIKTGKLNPDSISEKAWVSFMIDTTYNNAVFIRRDFYELKHIRHVDTYFNWESLGEESISIRRKSH